MDDLKRELISKVEKINGVEAKASTIPGTSALFYQGKEFAHFHSSTELDLRLTKKVIQKLGLQHPTDSTVHPKRSPNFPWIEVRYSTTAEVDHVVELVKLAVKEL